MLEVVLETRRTVLEPRLARELSKAGLLQYDNHCAGHYHIQQSVSYVWGQILGTRDLATGRYYIIVEE